MRVRASFSQGIEWLDEPLYVERFDVDYAGGMGAAWLTTEVAKAQVFPNLPTLFEAWRKQSTVRPLRDDGKPNRPLTAYSIEPEGVSG